MNAQPSVQGNWLVGFTHANDNPNSNYRWPPYSGSFNAAHMSVIPKPTPATASDPSFQGWVMVFGFPFTFWNGKQEWSIFDPEATPPVFYNFTLTIPNSPAGERQILLCSGHAWTKNGNLFVASGEKVVQGNIQGNQLVYIWDPSQWNGANGGWFLQPQQLGTQLAQQRYYPTVTVLGTGGVGEPDDKIMVSSGQITLTAPAPSTYEVAKLGPYSPPPTPVGPSVTWDTHTGAGNPQIYDGPQPNIHTADVLGIYPRMHLLSTRATFYSGSWRDNATMLHVRMSRPATIDITRGHWAQAQNNPSMFVGYHTSVLFPINLDLPLPFYDIVMRMGGAHMNEVEFCDTRTTNPWNNTVAPSMHRERDQANSVLLPDESVLVIGGYANTDAEYYKLSTNTWTLTPQMESPRSYHSTAVLLPSGRVLVGGGDTRSIDYQVYEPPYLFKGERPVITGVSATTMNYFMQYTVNHAEMTSPLSVQKVVLIRPGSVTHHFCMDQRCLVLKKVGDQTSSSKTFQTPPTPDAAPRGYYMLFLVSNAGVPSVATWVRLQ